MQASETTEAAFDPVIARALGGDAQAEREVCRRLMPAIRAFARRRLHAAAAEDFAQDALVTLVEAMREGRIHDPGASAAAKTITRVWAHDDSGRRLFAEIRLP